MPAQRPFEGEGHPDPVEYIELSDSEEEDQRQVERPDNGPNPLPLQIKEALDSNLPAHLFGTLDHWNMTFWRLAKKDIVERNKFALTGHFFYSRTNEIRRLSFDPTQNCRPLDDMVFTQLCDIDSILGIIYQDFPIRPAANVQYYMLPDLSYTLTSNLHIPPVRVPTNGDEVTAAVHTIPNCRFAQIGRALIRVMFPGLINQLKHQSNRCYVGDHYLRRFYDLGVRPAAQVQLPNHYERTWPVDFDAEHYRAQGTSGAHLQQTSRDFEGNELNPLLARIRELVDAHEDLSWARGFFFLLELRGVKHWSVHPPEDPVDFDPDQSLFDFEATPRQDALVALLKDFVSEEIDQNSWYVDVATTISIAEQDGHPLCTLPLAEAHTEMINHFTQKPMDQCERWTGSRAGAYQFDEIAHLGNVAGFRLDVSNSPSLQGVTYLQCYISDKSVTYHLDSSSGVHAKRTSPYQIMKNWDKVQSEHLIPLAEVWNKTGATHDVAVRIESRVKLSGLPFVHSTIPDATLRTWFARTKCSTYWGFKANRLLAITDVLNRVHMARDQLTKSALLKVGSLIVILAWMCNALVNRPDDGGKWNEVHDAGCVHDVEQGRVVAVRPLGIYYLHSLTLDNLPRISGLRTISKATLLYLSTPTPGTTELELICLIRGLGSAQKDPENAVSWGAGDEAPEPLVQLPPTSNKHRAVRVRLEDDAPDFMGNTVADLEPPEHHSDSEEEDPEEREELMSLGQQVNDVIHNYPVQIFAKTPNRRNERGETVGSWCLLAGDLRHTVTTRVMCNASRLPDLFLSCTLFEGSYEKWQESLATLFPTLKEWEELMSKAKKSQGLTHLEVWKQWGQLLSQLDAKSGRLLVHRTRKYINNHWQWLPYITKGHHLWSTGLYQTRSTRLIGDKNFKTGPWIVINPRR